MDKQRAEKFVEKLAEYLVENASRNSILLDLNDKDAKLWAAVRGCTSLFGYPSVEEARQVLRENIIEFAEALKS